QRVTGIGGTLVAAPILIVVSGASVGVTICLIANVVIAMAVLQSTWRHVRWARVPVVLLGVAAGSLLGAVTARMLSGPLLQIAIGTMIVLATTLVASGGQPRIARGQLGGLLAGGASGFINVLS